LSLAEKFKKMTTVLSNKNPNKPTGLVLGPDAFKEMLEKADPDLVNFFDEMCNAILPEDWPDSMRDENKKKVVTILHLIAGIRNMHANSFKLDLGLYLEASGTSCNAINALSNAGITVTYKTISNNKNKIAADHAERVKKYFVENVSVQQQIMQDIIINVI
jgi:hypothetical protein